MEQGTSKKGSTKRAYILGIVGLLITVGLAVMVIYFRDSVEALEQYGYLGAFLISIFGGATVIIPVPMLAVIFALGAVMKYTWLVGIAAGLGETMGALAIYLTGRGAGTALYNSKRSRIAAAYERIMQLMERRGSLTLFLVSSVINPFFYPAALTAGAVRFNIRKYLIICIIGKIIKDTTVAYAGYWGLRGIFQILGIAL